MTGIRTASRDRPGVWALGPAACLSAALATLFWANTLNGSGTGMSVWAMSGLNLPPVSSLPSHPQDWSAAYALLMVLMWWSMMLAMMLIPLTVQFAQSRKAPNLTQATAFLSGYGLVWLGFSVMAASLQWLLERQGLLHPFMMWSLSAPLSAFLLVFAGIYQLHPLKSGSRSACHPDNFSLARGLRFGAFCVLSTAPLMLLFFAGGLMNLYWMIALTLIVLVERTVPVASRYDWPLATMLIGLGLWTAFPGS
ncbi:DUF2182 domain-containing protein [Roseibium sp.]|uniref:DUF2182 domain-containing protein n=1 Tax=Roseibium sp. TaxID=1936156 RepID=UPI0039EF99B1